MATKASEYLLNHASLKRAAHIVAICTAAQGTAQGARDEARTLFVAEFTPKGGKGVSKAHLLEVAHYRAFGNVLRPQGGAPWPYQLYLEWVREVLHGRDKETGKLNPGPLPGRKGGGSGSKLTLGRFVNAWKSRGEAFAESVKQVRKAKGLLTEADLSLVTAALVAFNAATLALQRAQDAAVDAAEETEAQQA